LGIALSQVEEVSLIELDGVIDISVASELKAALVLAIEAGKPIRICGEDGVELDITAYQLLWAVTRDVKRAGRELALGGKLSEPVESMLAGAGLMELKATA
jgi:hypothetical protein